MQTKLTQMTERNEIYRESLRITTEDLGRAKNKILDLQRSLDQEREFSEQMLQENEDLLWSSRQSMVGKLCRACGRTETPESFREAVRDGDSTRWTEAAERAYLARHNLVIGRWEHPSRDDTQGARRDAAGGAGG